MASSRLPRWAHAIRAWATGYFWLPCRMCGESFGGHEASGYLSLDIGSGSIVCNDCAGDAQQRNEAHARSYTQYVVPGVGVYEFPNDMPQDEINARLEGVRP